MGIPLHITKKQLWNSTVAGFLFLAFGNGFVVWALKYVDSGFAALEIAAQPLVILLLMRILEGKRIQAMSVVGVVIGIFGIYLLVSQNQVISQENSVLGMVMIFLCMVSWAYGSLFVAKEDLPWSSQVQYAMLFLIVLGSIVAFTAFNYLLKVVSPEKVATSTYVNPIIALLLGWFFLDEQITTQSAIAAIVLLTGVYFINTRKKLVLFNRFSSRFAPKEDQ